MPGGLPPLDVDRADDFSPAELESVAEFGPRPRHPVGAVPYTINVLLRRRTLGRELKALDQLVQTAARDARAARVRLGRSLHEGRPDELVSALAEYFRAADEGRAATERAKDHQRDSLDAGEIQRSSLATQLAEAQRAVRPYQDQETKLQREHTVRETDLRRASARVSRVRIELRNAAGDPDKERTLQAELGAREKEAETIREAMATREPELRAVREGLAERLATVAALETELKSLGDAERQLRRSHASTAGRLEVEYEEALLVIAEQALANGSAERLCTDRAQTVEAMDRALAARTREAARHRAARDAFESRSLRHGLAMISIAGGLILAMLLAVLIG